MSVVLDGSMALAWCFEDETTPEVLEVLGRVVDGGAVAPGIWLYEVANTLLVAQRRGRLTDEQRLSQLNKLAGLEVEIDRSVESHPWDAVSTIAIRHRLTVYDAAYLELAQRRRLPIATLDNALRRAAADSGVTIV